MISATLAAKVGTHRLPRLQNPRGFSLIELMVVVVILSILAVVIVPRVIDRPDQARAVRAQSDIAAIESALNLYRLDNQRYPTTEQGLQALVEEPTRAPVPQNWADGGYIGRLPTDPWGQDYQYLNPGVHGDIDLFSLGADGRTGGSGVDADVVNWQ
ncbi:MAG: type II secretion system major pseudopilin GspG [Pseudomonadota bacterium]